MCELIYCSLLKEPHEQVHDGIRQEHDQQIWLVKGNH